MIGSKIRRMASKSIEYYAGSIGYFWWIIKMGLEYRVV